MNKKHVLGALIAICAFAPTTADAHVAAATGPWFANANQEVAFTIGHGCGGADTYRVTLDIPAGVTGVRPMSSDFGKVSVTKDTAGAVTSVTWQRDDADMLDEDLAFYKLIVRMKTP